MANLNNTTMDTFSLPLNISNVPRYTPEEVANALFQARVNRIGYGYVLFTIIFAGVLGNVLVFCVLTRKAMRTSTTAIYLQTLAVTDIFVLVTAGFRYKTYKMFMTDEGNTDAVFHFDPYVQVYVEPFFWIALGLSSYVTLLLSTERYLAVKFPLTMKRTCNVHLVALCIFAVGLIVTVITIPVFFSYEIKQIWFYNIQTSIVVPTTFGQQQRYVCTFSSYIIPLVWYMCPWVVLAAVNLLLIAQVRRSSRIRVGVPNVSNPNRNLSILIILVVVIYMVCNFPRCIISMMSLTSTKNSDCLSEIQTLTNPEYTASYLVAVVVAELLNVLNSCMNIIVYCFVGTKFRKEVRKLILCEPCHKHTTVNITNTIHVTLTRDATNSVTQNSPPPRASERQTCAM